VPLILPVSSSSSSLLQYFFAIIIVVLLWQLCFLVVFVISFAGSMTYGFYYMMSTWEGTKMSFALLLAWLGFNTSN